MFDRTVVVDWSANSTPKVGRDSIWMCVHEARSVTTENLRTRHDAAVALDELVARPGRTLIGVDFSLGYPAGTAAAMGLRGDPWAAMWRFLAESVTDDSNNCNNRFDVAAESNRRISGTATPFWGCPPSQRQATLASTKGDPAPLSEWRVVEATVRDRGHRPFSSWQLLGAGSVGSQSLLGIPMLHRLMVALDGHVDVWPFTSGLRVPERRVVLAEVWPSLVTLPTDDRRVRDDVQVETLATWLAECDLGGWFAPALNDSTRRVVEREEGWILGV